MKMLGLMVGDAATDRYILEVLVHAGLPFNLKTPKQLRIDKTPICLIAGHKKFNAEERAKLNWFVQQGGCLIVVGATDGLDKLLGVRVAGKLRDGWLRFVKPHPIGNGLQSSLHVFGGVIAHANSDAQVIAHVVNRYDEPIGDAVAIRRVGNGLVIFVAADLMRSIVHIQQGITVKKDGTPAPDGSAPIDDGILKAEDGLVLDWERDRIRLEQGTQSEGHGGNGKQIVFFGLPIADELRVLLLQAIFFAAQQKRLPLPMLWYWQSGLPAVGLISHDTDGNDPELGAELLKIVRNLGIVTTWCVLYPGGYPPFLYRAILDSGCEIALHFDAFTGSPLTTWSKRNLWVQWQWLKDATGVAAVSNKNHYTRWEGRLEFFRWCADLGITAEQSKGPSKRGTIGFLFGGSHPWRPLDEEREQPQFLSVTAINLFSQDMVSDETAQSGIFHPAIVPVSVGKWLLEQTVRMNGVAHLQFHPAHNRRQGTKAALEQLVHFGHELGLQWQTSQQIVDWLSKRRSVKQKVDNLNGKWVWRLEAAQSLEGATLLQLLPEESTQLSDRFVYGFPFAQRIMPLEGTVELAL
ncbi:MAG: hypothetical protein ACK40X_04730 [Armatimonadota bacterium]